MVCLRSYPWSIGINRDLWFLCYVVSDRYDFFLVSQNTRIGTVTPTHYNVIEDTLANWSPDKMQRLTYKLTHMYYNWAVSIFYLLQIAIDEWKLNIIIVVVCCCILMCFLKSCFFLFRVLLEFLPRVSWLTSWRSSQLNHCKQHLLLGWTICYTFYNINCISLIIIMMYNMFHYFFDKKTFFEPAILNYIIDFQTINLSRLYLLLRHNIIEH